MATPDMTESENAAAHTAQVFDKEASNSEAQAKAMTEAAADVSAAHPSAAAKIESASDGFSAPKVPPGMTGVTKKAPPPPPRAGMSVLLGGAIAAVIGAVATLGVLPKLPPEIRARFVPVATSGEAGAPQADAEISAKLAAIEKTMAELQAGTAELAALQTALGDLTAKVTALETQGGAAAPVDLSGLQGQLDALKEQFEKAPAFASQQALEAATAEAKAKIAAAEVETAKMRAESEAAAKKAVAQAAVARAAAAFAADAPLDGVLGEVAAAGISVPDPLKGALPTVAALKAEFPDAARAALATARRETAGKDIQDKLGSFLLAQVGARSLDAQEGDGPDAVLSRAQAAVDEARFDAALTEIETLPAAAQSDMQAWKEGVLRRQAAQAAFVDLTQSVQ